METSVDRAVHGADLARRLDALFINAPLRDYSLRTPNLPAVATDRGYRQSAGSSGMRARARVCSVGRHSSYFRYR